MRFRELLEELNREYAELDDENLNDAWVDAYESVNRIGAYYLYENGFELGEATLDSAIIDAKDRKIKVPENIGEEDDFAWQDWFIELIDSLNADFVDYYEDNLFELCRANKMNEEAKFSHQ